jgi:hypothetical protein
MRTIHHHHHQTAGPLFPMNAISITHEQFQGTSPISLYICIGANAAFALSGVLSFFIAVTTGDPFDHFDSQPKWMFMTFCTFAVVSLWSLMTGDLSITV